MTRSARPTSIAALLVLATAIAASGSARGDDAGPRDIPAPFLPFEYLVGRWNGQGVPKDKPAKQFRGWAETHTWAWAFAQGKPVGLTLTIEGGKVLATAKLNYDSGRKLFRLEATEPGTSREKTIYEGTLDRTGKHLVLDHAASAGKAGKSTGVLRLSMWPNANFIRYTMAYELKEPGSIQFTRLIEVGLTRDGESLAGAATISERPKCIVTGGAATMTMSYQGRTFAICCTGCRDEFNENPEKYIKKAALMAASQAGKPKSGQPAPTRVGRFEDAFAGDVTEPPAASAQPGSANSATKTMTKAAPAAKSAAASSSTSTAKATTSSDDRAAVARAAARAMSLLKLGRNLDKAGNTTAALGYYRQITKDFATTPAAKTAAERIKALE